MPQKTNLNISPYYDDFDKDNNFYKVLFKPGHPVQARELTTLQTMLQEQVSSFGSHIFKEGSMVIPGSLNYDPEYYSIKINDSHQGIPVSLYADKLKGIRLTGQSSGVTVTVDNYALAGSSSDVTDFTLYVKYLSSGGDNTVKTLEDGEELITDESFVYGNTAVNSGNTVATLISLGASAIGCAVGITTGVYFIRGTFVDVAQDKIVLDSYTNTPSYRVGLNILEEIVTAKEDDSLYDTARGYSNYAAPGADRLKISTVLAKKPLSDYNDKTFVELIKLDGGEIKKLQDKSQYSIIKDYFAKRTFEESGDYSVGNFGVELKNSLNDGISNEGIYLGTQVTEQLNTPSDDLMCVKVSSGKAYVRGFDVDKAGTTVLDVDKPRDKRAVGSSLASMEIGSLIKVNNVSGTPVVALGSANAVVNLHSQRKNSTSAANGTFICTAKVYSFNVSDAPYTGASTEWDLRLFDVQTFTGLAFNDTISNVFCPNSTYIRGLKSGATGYVAVHSGATTQVKYLSETSGTFLVGEEVIFNEDPSLKRTLIVVTPFGLNDAVSVYHNTSTVSGYSADFVADVVMKEKTIRGWRDSDKATINSGGVMTSATGADFTGLKNGDFVSYSVAGLSTATYGEVASVSADGTTATITAVTDVIGVADGSLPGSTIETSLKKLRGKTVSNQGGGLYAPLGSSDVSDLNLSNSSLVVTIHLVGRTTSNVGKLSADVGATGLSSSFYESFDAERYSVHYDNTTIAAIDSGDFISSNGGGNIDIDGLLANQSNVVLSSTVRKVGLRSKQKNFVRSEKVTISNTVVGVSTVITGLSTSQFYGTRVQDKEICLNVPDVVNVVGVYESLNTLDPTFDRLTFISGLGLDTNTIIGEKIIGADSGAVAQLTGRNSATEIEFVYLNSNKFTVGEVASFQESGITSPIVNVLLGNYLNISDGFTLDKGQKEQFYDYSRIVRRGDFLSPNRRITVVYNVFDAPTNDSGDVFTVESYTGSNYGTDIPVLTSGIRASDILDFRPRVGKFTATDKSPFQLSARTTWKTGCPLFGMVATPNESAILGYEHYLPRTDKLILDIDGNFSVIKGISALNPKEPTNVEGAMDIATINLPAYLYNPDDAIILVKDNRRFTMRDIGKIEDRVDTLETVTSLSLLELDTKTLQVQDASGLSRFKSGFFVDDFKDVNLLDIGNPECTVDINGHKREMNVPLNIYSLKPQLALKESTDYQTADFSSNLDLLDPNVQKTGDLITLKYDEVEWIEQPLASRVENVNPFNMIDFQGRVGLRPESDSWVRDVYVSGGVRNETGEPDQYIETIKISRQADPHMRSRNVGFEAGGLKPVTRYYPFFDSTSGIDIVPKLLEIRMNSGTFTPGETVRVYGGGDQRACIRICRPNHKGGNINNVESTFNANPYNTSVSLPSNYSASSDVLNIDIRSLTDDAQGQFWGYIPNSTNTVLLGLSSGAEARVRSVRLVTDTYGDLGGAWWFRNPLTSPPPPLRFRTGTKNFKLTSSSANSTPLPGSLLISSAETTYSSNGIVDTYRQTEVIVRRPPPPPEPPGGGGGHRGGGKDPLAQSFTVDETGAFLTSVDLFFGNKDPNEKIVVEVRTVELGTPTDQVVADYARVTLEPSQINTSATGETATKVTFPSPIYLQPREEYAIVLLSPSSDNYEAWIARMGERTVNTQSLPDAESVMVTRQYTGGSLFKSQNGTIWSPSQFEDLKFKLYKAKFTPNVGTAYFYNPSLERNVSSIQRLLPNAVKTLPRKLRVSVDDIPIAGNADLIAILSPGRKVSEGATTAAITRPTGFIEKAGGTVSGVSISNASSGYKPGTYNTSVTNSVTGDGTGLKLNITINASGVISAAAIADGGGGYVVGDVVTVDNTTVSNISGYGGEITISAISDVNTLFLTNVQGEAFTAGQDLIWYDDAGARVAGVGTVVVSSSVTSSLYSGNVLEINQYNHGMGGANNLVSLANISPDTVPELLTADLNTSDTTISVASTVVFSTYQGITTNSGYVQINNEIIEYNSIGSGTLGIGARGVIGSLTRSHNINDPCYSYQLNGIGLTSINVDHTLPSDATMMNAKDIHKYHIQVTRPDNRDTGDDMVNFTDEQSLGENDIFASQNFQFNGIQPQFNVITPGEKTSVSSKIRTVSATSAGGSEVSFIDKGFESVELNQMNELDSTRMVAARVNENEFLNTLPKQRSTTLAVQFNSEDENLSPVLDTATGTLILKRDLVNKPISNYVTDARSNQLTGDPHSAVYLSKRIDLQQPATSLKVMVGACIHSSADFRVLYQLHRQGSNEVGQSYELFPGYDNLRDTDGDGYGDLVIDANKNSGRADAVVPVSRDDQFREYQFTQDNLEEFVGFTIKIVASGTDEANAPRFKDLRVLALA